MVLDSQSVVVAGALQHALHRIDELADVGRGGQAMRRPFGRAQQALHQLRVDGRSARRELAERVNDLALRVGLKWYAPDPGWARVDQEPTS